MSSVVTHNLASRGIKAEFKFTDTQSLRLFVEGLQGLQAFERSAQKESLAEADVKLTQCVAQYPRDVLPRFYLGIVRVAQGYDGAIEAIRLFQTIAQTVKSLRAASLYNLAAANIELYTTDSLDTAQKELKQLLEELGNRDSVEDATLRFQSRVLLIFYEIRQNLWRKRDKPIDALQDEINKTLPELRKQLKELKEDLDSDTRVPEIAKSDILADYWNDEGLLCWFEASIASTKDEKQKLAVNAIDSFTAALNEKLNWIPAKQNIARIYIDLLDDYRSARRCCEEVQKIRPGDEYCEYLLGLADEKQEKVDSAEAHYKNAPRITEAKKHLAVLYEPHRRNDAILLWQDILSQCPKDEDGLNAQTRLGFQVTPASSAEPTA